MSSIVIEASSFEVSRSLDLPGLALRQFNQNQLKTGFQIKTGFKIFSSVFMASRKVKKLSQLEYGVVSSA